MITHIFIDARNPPKQDPVDYRELPELGIIPITPDMGIDTGETEAAIRGGLLEHLERGEVPEIGTPPKITPYLN